MIVLGAAPSAQMAAVRLSTKLAPTPTAAFAETTTRSLLWIFARAIERCELVRDHRRLLQNEQQRLAQEHRRRERLLGEQRALIAELERIRDGRGGESPDGVAFEYPPSPPLHVSLSCIGAPDRLVAHYREMLRAYVVMGAGQPGGRDDHARFAADGSRCLGPARDAASRARARKS